MKNVNWKNLIFNILVPLGLGSFVGFLARGDFGYIESLNRTLKVPPIIFPIVWSILYVFMGIWAYFNEKENHKSLYLIYWISVVVNILFTPLLFTLHLIVLATIDTILLLILVIYMFVKTILDKKKYAYFLLPYCIWLFVALTLMIDLWIHNL